MQLQRYHFTMHAILGMIQWNPLVVLESLHDLECAFVPCIHTCEVNYSEWQGCQMAYMQCYRMTTGKPRSLWTGHLRAEHSLFVACKTALYCPIQGSLRFSHNRFKKHDLGIGIWGLVVSPTLQESISERDVATTGLFIALMYMLLTYQLSLTCSANSVRADIWVNISAAC